MWVDGIMMQTFSCDIETDGIEATKVWCVAVQDIYTEDTQVFYESKDFNEWIDSQILVFHNGIAFDIPVLARAMGY